MVEAVGDWIQTPTASLRQLGTSVLTGPFGTQLSASEYIDGGVPVVNPVHIRRGRIEPETGVTIPDDVAVRLARHRLRAGDLVLCRKGDVGRAALVEPHADGWICGSDSIAVRPSSRRLASRYLAGILRIDYYRQYLVANSTGAMLANLNESTLLSLRVPKLSLDAQAAAIGRLHKIHEHRDGLATHLTRQIALLKEHRQTLITATTTGEFEIPGASA
jgi:type I restriction enzyme S subunit